MNTQSKKSTQIFQGILTGIGIWIVGHLMSGRLAFVENIELYPTGFLVFAFPLVFAAACILVAKHSAKTGKSTYYITSLICFFLPVVCMLMSQLVAFISELRIPVISAVAEFFVVIFMLPTIAMFSIYYQFLSVIGTGIDGIKLLLISAMYFLPMIAGLIVSLKIYKDNS